MALPRSQTSSCVWAGVHISCLHICWSMSTTGSPQLWEAMRAKKAVTSTILSRVRHQYPHSSMSNYMQDTCADAPFADKSIAKFPRGSRSILFHRKPQRKKIMNRSKDSKRTRTMNEAACFPVLNSVSDLKTDRRKCLPPIASWSMSSLPPQNTTDHHHALNVSLAENCDSGF